MTSTAAALFPTARERAMALDLLDAEPITRLTEDERTEFPEDDEADLDEAEDFWWARHAVLFDN